MPFIIWGSRGVNSQVEAGDFFCPNCNCECRYRLMESKPFFTIFFIPVFPIGAAQRYVECDQCKQTYLERVLEMGPPSEADRVAGQLLNELATGSSIEFVQRKLEAAGLARDKAIVLLDQLTRGQTWQCNGCAEHYLNAVKKCLRCNS